MIKFNNEKLIAYLTLISGLSISAVAVYYSVIGLTAIFAAAVVPIIIMGVALEVSKLIATIWLKQNWNVAHWFIKTYLIGAILILMFITSMGIFGFLSKAHSDQNLVSSEVLAKIAVYDERIKAEKENIEAARKALKQMDEGVDQILGRSTTETGADKAVALRKSQQKERARLQTEISQSQKLITELNNSRAPIAAEVRKVEAEVGPLKYIASFFYGSTDQTILEKSVTWVIIILIVVFDPLAIILLLASQISFQDFRQREKELSDFYEMNQAQRDYFRNDVPEIPDDITLDNINAEGDSPKKESNVTFPDIESDFDLSKHPYLFNRPKSYHPPGVDPVPPQVYKPDIVDTRLSLEEATALADAADNKKSEWMPLDTVSEPPQPTKIIESNGVRRKIFRRPPQSEYVQNEEQKESNLWSQTTSSNTAITEEEYMAVSKNKNLS